jgi:hypothetical protein
MNWSPARETLCRFDPETRGGPLLCHPSVDFFIALKALDRQRRPGKTSGTKTGVSVQSRIPMRRMSMLPEYPKPACVR